MQLRFDDSADGDFRASLRNRLTDSYEVQIVKKAAPELVVSGVRIERRVLSLSATGKASEFLLRFQVSFALLYSDGSTMIEKQTVRLQRDFRFDNTNILASKLEETRLSEQMQNDAVRRILRRVQALTKNL
ncbi:MAG: LPS assembly lipoprotein LptE [Acidiferrobacterales bacterium]